MESFFPVEIGFGPQSVIANYFLQNLECLVFHRSNHPHSSIHWRSQRFELDHTFVLEALADLLIVENVVAFSVAAALVDKFGGDSIEEMRARWELYQKLVTSR